MVTPQTSELPAAYQTKNFAPIVNTRSQAILRQMENQMQTRLQDQIAKTFETSATPPEERQPQIE